MSKTAKKEKTIKLQIDLTESVLNKLQIEANNEMRDRKNHIQKILTDYANKLPIS